MKRFLCAIAIMAIGICAVFAASGGAGKKVKWELKDGTLTFSGTGPMKRQRPPLAYRYGTCDSCM